MGKGCWRRNAGILLAAALLLWGLPAAAAGQTAGDFTARWYRNPRGSLQDRKCRAISRFGQLGERGGTNWYGAIFSVGAGSDLERQVDAYWQWKTSIQRPFRWARAYNQWINNEWCRGLLRLVW